MRKVLTYGTFDLFHIGHLNILKRAKEYGDFLIVALSTDEFNRDQKSKQSVISYEDRKAILEAICYVDLVIPEKSWDQKEQDIQKYGVDLFVMGDDWKGKFDYLKAYCEVVYLPRTQKVSSSELKKHINLNPLKAFNR